MLSYLQGSTLPEISISIHQCAHFLNNPHLVHERAIRRIANYLVSTSTYVDLPNINIRLTIRGVVSSPDIKKSIKCSVDAEFPGGWAQADSGNAENFMLRTGYVLFRSSRSHWFGENCLDSATAIQP